MHDGEKMRGFTDSRIDMNMRLPQKGSQRMKSELSPFVFSRKCLMAWLVSSGLGVALFAGTVQARVETDLSGPGWKLWQDRAAAWKDDALFAPPVDMSKVPANPPTGGWETLNGTNPVPVSIPGTIEEYLGKGNGPENFTGVSWWFRTIKVPAFEGPKKVLLRFESARQRAEIYLDQKLVGYDVVGNTPFEVDISTLVKPGAEHKLAVRITNPGGNFTWVDFQSVGWGKYVFPGGHNFSGITGGAKLLVCDPVYIDDIYVQNTPAISNANVIVTINNSLATVTRKTVQVTVTPKNNPAQQTTFLIKEVELKPGETVATQAVSVANVKLWDTDNPNLYVCEVSLLDSGKTTDTCSQRFGFRWFTMEGAGQDAMLRLNGKRIVGRTAISWGFWPINGIYPTPELAERQIRTAKAMGLNMLNFHRCIGNPIVMDMADELGLLYFEEPGGYVSVGNHEFGMTMASEKLFRMVKRDRSHPSLVIYNLINEQWWLYGAPEEKGPVFARHLSDLTRSHELDPSRIITYASSWAEPVKEQRLKLHMRPFDSKPYYSGWYDFHNAGGPEVWRSEYYKSPREMYGLTDNRGEIVFWGEEGAMSAPPRLEKIKADMAKMPNKGWDGGVWLRWYDMMDEFMTKKDLRKTFPTVDSLCLAMGAVSHEHQGRKIENVRIQNVGDSYAINGWECEIAENHSGVVDCFRFPKADPALISYYNQPLYVAVKCRNQVVESGDSAVVDFYVVNEKDLKGEYTLSITAITPSGRKCFSKQLPVTITGGDVFGQLLKEEVKIPLSHAGTCRIKASLVDAAGKEYASGREEVLCVDWKKARIRGKGAVYEQETVVKNFLGNEKKLAVPDYNNDMGKLDWVLIARGMKSVATPVSPGNLRDLSGKKEGLTATFFKGRDFKEKIHERLDGMIDFTWALGSTPDPAVKTISDYCVRWEGTLIPPSTGSYEFSTKSDDGVRLWIDGQQVINQWKDGIYDQKASITLTAGKPVSIKMEYYQAGGGAEIHLMWVIPNTGSLDLAKLIDRVKNDGTTLVITDYANDWVGALKGLVPIKYNGTFGVGDCWNGGQYFVKEHPLFKELPVNQALNWPYELLVRVGYTRYGLVMEGEELVSGCYSAQSGQLGTAVGVVPLGKGKIIISTLRITDSLADKGSSVHVVKKLLCNYLEFAGKN